MKKLINLFPKDFTPDFLVFLHKYDPELESNPLYSESTIQNELILPIKKIVPPNLNLQIMKSTILTALKTTKVD
jgi:hypothetical protein